MRIGLYQAIEALQATPLKLDGTKTSKHEMIATAEFRVAFSEPRIATAQFLKAIAKLLITAALPLTLFSCATRSLSQSEVAERPERAYLAFSTSANENDTEAVELVNSNGRARDLATTGSPLKLADENFFFFELDPKQAYAFTKASNGRFSSRIDRGQLRQIRLEPGTITYVGSFMLWASGESFYSDVLLTEAKADSGASHALKATFPKRKIRYGFAP